MTDPPAILYPVRNGISNDELKMSLRSLVNLPHGPVFMVGYKPPWVTGVTYISGGNSATYPRANLYNNLRLACDFPDLPDSFTIFNDDFLVTCVIEAVPVLYRGRLNEQVRKVLKTAGRKGWWQESLICTAETLTQAGYDDPLSYELHTPFPCNKQLMADTLKRFADVTPHNPPQWRSLYGVVNAIGGREHPDCKALRPTPITKPFFSTEDVSWRYFRAKFLQMFPDPSPYELPAAARSAVNLPPRQHLRTARRYRA